MARRTLLVVLALGAIWLPGGALADDGDDEARVSGTCSRPARSELRLRADDGRIEIEVRLDRLSRRGAWRVIVLHERRIAYRGQLRPRSSSASVRVRASVDDLFGPDTVVVRAAGPRGESCRISATV